ncbi:hypothetical protein MMC29_006322 [Sticta canariensis]|nr:hypothetical protein [Sticta canariensis]
MKAFRLLRWSGSVLSPRTRPFCLQNHIALRICFQSTYQRDEADVYRLTTQPTVASKLQPDTSSNNIQSSFQPPPPPPPPAEELPLDLSTLPSPPPSLAASSAKLCALYARLSLPPRFPVETLARCLVDPSADPDFAFNNEALAKLGADILGYHTSEYLLCRYPRLPSEVLFAVMWAYCGPDTLQIIANEWGVEAAAAPGGEVDSGYLQFKRKLPGNADSRTQPGKWIKELEDNIDGSRGREKVWRRGASSRSFHDDEFGTLGSVHDFKQRKLRGKDAVVPIREGVTLTKASTEFVRAVFGAVYLHCGRRAAKLFFKGHIISRHLDVSAMFAFKEPMRELSRLCAREGFESPVARILSETGRRSRHPVFVVGVFADRQKLGEAAGASLDEARLRASIHALKGWYLYSPLELRVPSDAEGPNAKSWEPVLIDGGEVIV